MKINIFATATFEKEFKHLKKKYQSLNDDILNFENMLLNNPDLGIDLGGGLRKIRISVKSKNKGKSGGARVITYNIIVSVFEKNIFLLTIYDKSEKENITPVEIKQILAECGF